jgi:glycine dehydrogenase subunit 2
MSELIFEKESLNLGEHVPGPSADFKLSDHIPQKFLRNNRAFLPNLSELEVVRHYTGLSKKNFCVDANFYPLGSCTMKYNPKVNDMVSGWPFYARVHPYQREETTQGILEVIHELEGALCEITGMDAFTLQPAAGAQGELAGLLMVRAYHAGRKSRRTKILIPDSAHGTNPASAALCGYEVVQVKTNHLGRVDLADLELKLDKETACFMITNPNTLGMFEINIQKICDLVHAKGALVYFDGANMNALLGLTRPGDMGFDVVHVNLHKTFAVPHGSGGPGSGPVGVKAHLEKFLPSPRLKKDKNGWAWNYKRPYSIGRLRSFYGNFGALIRSYVYISALGKEGLKAVSENAILNANYLKARLSEYYDVPYSNYCMHEFILSATKQKARGVKALDIAKRLLDYGIHAPTIYFPMIVEEAMMIEPTETESKETLDRFVLTMITIDHETKNTPQKVLQAPTKTPVRRINEVLAARKPNLRWTPLHEPDLATAEV